MSLHTSSTNLADRTGLEEFADGQPGQRSLEPKRSAKSGSGVCKARAVRESGKDFADNAVEVDNEFLSNFDGRRNISVQLNWDLELTERLDVFT